MIFGTKRNTFSEYVWAVARSSATLASTTSIDARRRECVGFGSEDIVSGWEWEGRTTAWVESGARRINGIRVLLVRAVWCKNAVGGARDEVRLCAYEMDITSFYIITTTAKKNAMYIE